ncbi:MAG: helix-turn-helix domain-containing protein [Chloroflexota bacterium]|nr:helix-turn-helix domain-containing protein [Chloroflexota bacterium]
MSGSSSPTSSASVRNILTLLASRDAHLVGGVEGLERRVTWSCRMRARLPAFESVHGGELALLGISQLRRLDESLPHLLKSLHQEGVAAVAVAAPSSEALGEEACTLANQLHLPLILLPQSTSLEVIEREVITFVVSFRGEIERKATELSHQLMQLSIQGAGIQGICEQIANSCNKWVVVQDIEHHIRLQATPAEASMLSLPATLDDQILWQQSLTQILAPILIRYEVVGFLSLIGSDGDFDYLDRIILGQVVPILALEFAREKERSDVENRYQLEAFLDVLQGNYQQPEEMLVRARLLGYDLTTPQVVTIFEFHSDEPEHPPGSPKAQWNRRVRDELLLAWPSCWILHEARRVTALLPLITADNHSNPSASDNENTLLTRVERVHARLQQNNNAALPAYSIGIGRAARKLQGIPQSYREAQQALEIGRQLFGENKIHPFAHLGIYRLLFLLKGQSELNDFYQETLGPLLNADTRGDGSLITTLEGYFRCNGNLSKTARAMHLHRNSLLYRLGRIEEILGRSLDDPELRLSLQIALKIRHLLQK